MSLSVEKLNNSSEEDAIHKDHTHIQTATDPHICKTLLLFVHLYVVIDQVSNLWGIH